MKAIRHCYYTLFFLLICHTLHSAEESKEKELPVPNPLELKQDWWKYFDVEEGKVQENLQAFKKELLALKDSLQDESHKEIHKMIDQVFLLLDLVMQKKEAVQPSKPPELKLLKSYSLDELLQVHEKKLRIQTDIEAKRSQINILQSRVNRIQSALDRAIIHYQGLSPATFEKLKQGMKIIELRAELALQSIDLARERDSLNYFLKERDQIKEELTAATGRLHIEDNTHAQLQERKAAAEKAFEEAKEQLFNLEKQSRLIDKRGGEDEFACCLGDNQALSQAIVVENYKVKLLVNDIKMKLAKLAIDHQDTDLNKVQVQLADWRKQLDVAEEQYKYWGQKIKDDQSQVSRMTAQSIQEDGDADTEKEDLIGDIHFELDKSLAELELLNIRIEDGLFLSRLVEERLVQTKSFMETWLITLNGFWYKTKGFIEYWTHLTLFRVKEHPITLMTFIKAILIFLGSLLFSFYLRKFLVKKQIVQRSFSRSTEYILLRLIHYAIIIIGLLISLSYIGIDFTNLAIVAGALGVGIGFGLQTIVSNISSGFMLLLKKYLKVGDVIELADKSLGTISAVNLQNTIIRTFDGAEVMVPNSQLSSQRLTNWTMKDNARRFRIPFGVAYGTDKELVRSSVIEAIKKLPFVHSDDFRYPDPQVWLVEFGDSSMNFELVAWVDLSIPVPYETSRSALMWELDNTLMRNGIEIPFPQSDLHIKSMPSDS